MLKAKILKLGASLSLLAALGACSTAERLANVGKAPDITPIEDVKALEKSLMPISKWLKSLQTQDAEEQEREAMPILK